MKRILTLAGYFYPHIGGYEKNVYELSRRLVQRGYEVDILTCNTEHSSTYEELEGIHIYRIPSWNALSSTYPVPKPSLTSFRILRRLLRKNYDVINTQTRFFITSFLGLVFAKVKKTPLVHTERGTRHSIVANKVIDLVSRAYDHGIGTLIVKSATRNIGVSEAACEFLKHLGATDTQLIYNGIDTTIFRKKDANYRQKLGISNNALLITFVGRLIYAKGVQDLISVFPKIKETIPDAKLLIVGDGPYRANLENMACQNDCSADTVFLGQKNQDELIDILSATDIFVNPSYSEGLPTSDVGGTREIIADCESGMLVEIKDVEQIERKLRELFTSIELRTELGSNARISVNKKFDWDKITDRWINYCIT